jgi:RIP homotypic interaction motif
MIVFSAYSQANAIETPPSLQSESLDKIETITSNSQKVQIGNNNLADCVANAGNCNKGKNCKQDSDCGFITQGCSCQNHVCRDITSSES